MKKKSNLPLILVTLLLLIAAGALVVTLLSLQEARSHITLLEEQVVVLSQENQDLDNRNQTLQLQLETTFLPQADASSTYVEEDYCALLVEDWSVAEDVLSFEALAEVYLTAPAEISARLELWRGDAVHSTQPVTLNQKGTPSVYEGKLSGSFRIPQITEGEELQLWLMVEPAGHDSIFACAAGWYLENGEIAIIAG